MQRCYVALGTNLGDRLLNLGEARRRLALLGEHRPGPVLESPALLPPGDPTPQPAYLNGVDQLDTPLTAVALFHQLKRIERQMGRLVATRWAPRLIDLDLILFGDQVIQTAELTVPHPAMHQRRFVLEPLAALAPDAWHPIFRCTARELLERTGLPAFGASVLRGRRSRDAVLGEPRDCSRAAPVGPGRAGPSSESPAVRR